MFRTDLTLITTATLVGAGWVKVTLESGRIVQHTLGSVKSCQHDCYYSDNAMLHFCFIA
jgi:hypothetical protein